RAREASSACCKNRTGEQALPTEAAKTREAPAALREGGFSAMMQEPGPRQQERFVQVAQRLKEKYKCLPPQVTERSHLALPPAFAQLAMGKQYDLVIGVMIPDDFHGLIRRAGPY